MEDHGFAVPTTRAEAQAYIEHEFTKGETLNPEELYEPTNVADSSLYNVGQTGIALLIYYSPSSKEQVYSRSSVGAIDHLMHPEGEMGRTLHKTEKHHKELNLYSDADSGGEADE
eukprot:Phypoly_transcript_25750.p1 GENE.Phypoly_transcript_25750~~Phypoly_transcript_25750.p1  ORF type:complete len:115 (+),score=19.46 Phypoly_transcript_25750:130-474(+)